MNDMAKYLPFFWLALLCLLYGIVMLISTDFGQEEWDRYETRRLVHGVLCTAIGIVLVPATWLTAWFLHRILK